MLLYDTTKNNISMHLKNIFDKGELQKDSVGAVGKLNN